MALTITASGEPVEVTTDKSPSLAKTIRQVDRLCDHPPSRLMQNLRRGHYELGVDALPGFGSRRHFDELARVV